MYPPDWLGSIKKMGARIRRMLKEVEKISKNSPEGLLFWMTISLSRWVSIHQNPQVL